MKKAEPETTKLDEISSVRDVRWGLEQRLAFIEFRLFWEHGINRSALINRFGISVPQASNDLRRYEESAPGNLLYDKKNRRYVASPNFTPRFLKPDADQYLNRLRSVTDGAVNVADSWFSQIPPAESMPLPHRKVDVDVLRRLLDAIRRERSLRVLYQSMNSNNPDPLWRWISPHAFANDGLRWHVRAFCHKDSKFKDFLLSRCLGADSDEHQAKSGSADLSWLEYFDIVLVPNPKLSSGQQAVIAQDYCMENGRISVSIRKSFMYYFKKRLRLDVADVLDDPNETPVVVENQEAFVSALGESNRLL